MILAFFWDFSELFLYRKSHGSGLWITGPQMTLGSLLTHDHGAERLLRGSGVRRDSSEREGERRSSRFSNGATCRRSCGDDHTTVFNRGDRWCSDGEVISSAMRDCSQGGAMDNVGALIVPFIGS
jgi:hypothetical protein